jgi:hypothetical protein
MFYDMYIYIILGRSVRFELSVKWKLLRIDRNTNYNRPTNINVDPQC